MTTEPLTLTASAPSQTEEIYYPETDGMPLPDGREQEPQYREAVSILEDRFKGPRTFVSGNTFIYYVEGDASRRFAPDCYVVFDVDMTSIDRRNTYLVWEVGKSPDFAMEIGSRSTGGNDLGPKRDLYASLGIGEYWRFDPTGGDFYGEPLVGERLVDGEYVRFETRQEPDGRIWGHSPTLGLDLNWTDGRLRFYDPVAEEWLENFPEAVTRANSAEARAEAAEARADSAEAERDIASARADREAALRAEVEAELRALRERLGGDSRDPPR